MSADSITFHRFAMFDLDRWMGSDTYNATTGEERRLLVPFFLWQSQNGPILDDALLLYRIAYSDDDEPCKAFLARIRSTLTKAFILEEDRTWRNPTAMLAYAKHASGKAALVEAGRRGGIASAAKRSQARVEATLEATLEGGLEASLQAPSPSPSLSLISQITSEVTGNVIGQITRENKGEQMALACIEPIIEAKLVEPVTVTPPTREKGVRDLALRYLQARALRLWGKDQKPSEGMVRAISKRIDARLRDGFDGDFLVALPVLIEDRAMRDGARLIDAMLKSDPEVPLREDNGQGGKLHARRIEGTLPDLVLGQRLVDILKATGSWDWVRARVKVKEGVC